MGLQLFSGRTWEEDSFNETNLESLSIDLAESRKRIQPSYEKDNVIYLQNRKMILYSKKNNLENFAA